MNKNLVTSLELSRELKELGVKQKSEFYWTGLQRKDNKGVFGSSFEIKHIKEIEAYDGGSFNNYEIVKQTSAFLSGELGEMLPEMVYTYRTKKNCWHPDCSDTGLEHSKLRKEKWNVAGIKTKTEAEARGEMLVYLIKNGLLKNKPIK